MAEHLLTIALDDEVDAAIRREAEAAGSSTDRAALRLIRRGAGLETQEPELIGSRAEKYRGRMTREDAEAVLRSVEEQDRIDLDESGS